MTETTSLQDDGTTARSELREQAGRVKDDLGNLAHIAGRTVREELGHLRDTASGAAGSVRDRAVSLRDGLERRVEARPKASLAVAAAVGLLFGFLWARRR